MVYIWGLTNCFVYGPARMLILIGCGRFVNRYRVTQIDLSNVTFIGDLWGMSLRTGQTLVPDYLLVDPDAVTLGHMKEVCSPYTAAIFHRPESGLRGSHYVDRVVSRRVKRDFSRIVWAHPLDYFRVRMRTTANALGFAGTRHDACHTGIVEYPGFPVMVRMRPNSVTRMILACVRGAERLGSFQAWPYLLVLLGIVSLAFVKRVRHGDRAGMAIAVAACGLLYWLPYPLILPCTDFRYNSLTISACVPCAVLLLGDGSFLAPSAAEVRLHAPGAPRYATPGTG